MKSYLFNDYGITLYTYLMEDYQDVLDAVEVLVEQSVVTLDSETEDAYSYYLNSIVNRMSPPRDRFLRHQDIYKKLKTEYVRKPAETYYDFTQSRTDTYYRYSEKTHKTTKCKVTLAQAAKPYFESDLNKTKRFNTLKQDILKNPKVDTKGGLRHYRNMIQLVQVGYALYDGTYIGYLCPAYLIQFLIEQLEEKYKGTYLMHSAAFDIRMIQHHTGIRIDSKRVWDTKIAEHVIRNGKDLKGSYSMDKTVKRRFDIEIDKDKAVRVGHWGGHLNERQLAYAAYDVVWPHKIWLEQLSECDETVLKVLQFEFGLINKTVDMELVGVGVDRDYLLELIKELPKEVSQKAKKALEILNRPQYTQTLLNSPTRLLEVLQSIGHSELESTADGHLKEYCDRCEAFVPVYEALSDYRSSVKMMNTYLSPILDKLVELPDGSFRLYGNFNQLDTETSRYSSSDPNMQNFPKEEWFRRLFKARKGCMYIQADYSSVEPRVFAGVSKDRFLIDAFLHGRDPYMLLGSMLKGVQYEEVDKELRNVLKAVILGLIYGKSEWGLSYDLKITPEEARGLIYGVRNIILGASRYMDKLIETAKEKGYAETLRGRRRYLLGFGGDKRDQKHAKNQSLNTPIQGTAAEIMKQAIADYVYDKELSSVIHDELWVEVLMEDVAQRSPYVKATMEGAGRQFITNVPILIGDAPEHLPKVVSNLGEAM